MLESYNCCSSKGRFSTSGTFCEIEPLKPSLSMVFPVYNEAPTIEKVLLAYCKEIATKIPAEIIVAEDGSTDGTKEILLSLENRIPIKLFLGEDRKGYARAVSGALKRATSDLIFFSDSDGQYRPKDFWVLWEKRDGYDMVIGQKVRRREPQHRILLSKGFHMMVKALFGVNLHDIDCGFRLMRREVVDAIINDVRCLEHSFWAEFTIRAFLKGYRIAEVPICHRSRAYGFTHIYKLKKIPWIVLRQVKGLYDLRSELNGRTMI